MDKKIVDVLIVGSGISGLFCALNIDKNLNVLLISKSKLEETNSYLAQGGICVSRDENDIEPFIEDTMKAGKMKNNIDNVSIMVKESRENINLLESFGVVFDRTEDGLDYDYTREGGHRIHRILHTKDNTGESICEALIKKVKTYPNIEILEDTRFIDILENNDECIGALLNKEEKFINVYAKKVVLATGGIGGLFTNSTNQRTLTGDALYTSIKHNIKLKDIEYVQIHPTGFYEEGNSDRRLLISESVRGEGGILKNIHGERFVDELLPRDIVSKAIYEEMKKTNSHYVYLDVTFMDVDYLKNRFSLIYSECLKRGTDITKDLIKISPVQHYFMGGIEVDENSKTSMKNLYAVGETSCTGIHGGNRLASNSLLEGVVFSNRCAKNINKNICNEKLNICMERKDNIINLKDIIEEENNIVRNKIRECFGEENYELLNY